MLFPFLSSIGTQVFSLAGRKAGEQQRISPHPSKGCQSLCPDTQHTQTTPPSPDTSAARKQAHFNPRAWKRKLKPLSKGTPSQVTCT